MRVENELSNVVETQKTVAPCKMYDMKTCIFVYLQEFAKS